ncbi:hypothetical protein AAG906_006867 [Vitis piasezkii]
MSFDQHSSTLVLDMMRDMSFLPVDHDTPFDLGFVPTEGDYRYMVLLHKERLRARLFHMPFDYPIRPYRMSLADYFVRAPEGTTWLMDLDGN